MDTNRLAVSVPEPDYLVLDIETGPAPEDAIERAAKEWSPPSNWKPETVEKNRAAYLKKLRMRSSLMDAAPILCVGVKTERYSAMHQWMSPNMDPIPGWDMRTARDEADMLFKLGQTLDSMTGPETILAGHGIVRFDLPKIRNAMARFGVPLPLCLIPRPGTDQPTYDTERMLRYFSVEHADDRMSSFRAVARALNMACHKDIVSGDMVQELYQQKRYREICQYNVLDVLAEKRAFLAMTQGARQ